MKMWIGSLALLALGPPLDAQERSQSATAADIRLIQAEADLLDESLETVRDDAPEAGELRRREQELRDDVQRLAEQVRRSQQDEGQGGPGASKAEIESLRRDIVALRHDVEA